MKKFILFLFISMLTINSFPNVSAHDENLISRLDDFNLIDKSRINDNYISRERCVVIICRATGIHKKMLGEYFFYMPYTMPFTDVTSLSTCGPYVYFAYAHDIVAGCGDRIFNPESDTTYGEAISFILRTIEKTDNIDIEKSYMRAKQIGLLQTDDDFYDKQNERVSYYDLCVLINRMILYNSYIDVTSPYGYIENSKKDFTYYDALRALKNSGYDPQNLNKSDDDWYLDYIY